MSATTWPCCMVLVKRGLLFGYRIGVLWISSDVYEDVYEDDDDDDDDDEHTAYSPSRQFPAIPSTYQGSNPSPAPWSVEKARSAWRSEVRWLSSKWSLNICNLVKIHTDHTSMQEFPIWNKTSVRWRNPSEDLGVAISQYKELPDLIRLRWANPLWSFMYNSDRLPPNPICNRFKILNQSFNWRILNFTFTVPLYRSVPNCPRRFATLSRLSSGTTTEVVISARWFTWINLQREKNQGNIKGPFKSEHHWFSVKKMKHFIHGGRVPSEIEVKSYLTGGFRTCCQRFWRYFQVVV